MVRPLLALPLLLALITPAMAAPATPAPATSATTETVAPTAGMQAKPDPINFLTGIYATRAVIEICNVTVDQKISTAMLADQVRYEREMQYDPGTAAAAYQSIKTSVAKTNPDCKDGSADRQGVDVVLAAYAKQ